MVILFSLAGALAIFQRMMEEVLQDISEAQVFINDISIGAPTFYQLCNLLDQVFAQLTEYNLCLSKKKCITFVNKLTLLGIIVTAQGISVDPKWLADIRQIPEPYNVCEVCSLLSVFGFCWHFILGYATLTALLYLLLQKNQLF